MASITKSEGTMLNRDIVGSPITGTSAHLGMRISHCSRK